MANYDRASYHDQGARPSFDPYAQGHDRSQSIGYNAASFAPPSRQAPLKPGRDEEEPSDAFSPTGGAGWDTYNDFNNVGPRMSSFNATTDKQGYRPLPNRTDNKSESGAAGTPEVELVTVPAFGAEWQKDELRGMTRTGKRAARSEARSAKIKAWFRNESGGRYFARRTLVFVVFGLCLLAGIVLAICIPRVPSFAFNSQTPFRPVSDQGGPEQYKYAFSRTPANFSFNAWMDLRIDTHSSNVPVNFKFMRAKVYEMGDYKLVATGNITDRMFSAKKSENFLFPMRFEYEAVNSSDVTWLRFYDACKNHVNYQNGERPGVNIRVQIEMSIRGRPGLAGTTTPINGAACPIELPNDSA